METYVINGHEVEYDTFDLDAMERYDQEVKRIKDGADALKNSGVSPDNYIPCLREQCEAILDFFDVVLGDGAAQTIFGGKTNIKEILGAYQAFTADVANAIRGFTPAAAAAPGNREQRRAMEREARRKQAVQAVTAIEK